MNKTEKTIERVNKYLALIRYNYSSQEKLKKLKILSDYYYTKGKSASQEKLERVSSIEVVGGEVFTAEQLKAGKFTMPLKVRGTFLREGRPQRKFYPATELELAAANPVNQSFPLMLDHKDKEAGKVIGMVDKIKYNAETKALDWWGHINDETFARNVLDRAIKEVSATIMSIEDYDDEFGLVGRDLTFNELSLVMKGAVENNSIEAY